MADYSGDGKGDLASWKNGGMHTHAAHINFATDMFPDLAATILNLFGGQNSIVYKPITDSSVYTKDSGTLAAVYPNTDLHYPLYVVAQITASDAANSYPSSYLYAGAKAHLRGRGFLGFRMTDFFDSSEGSGTTTFFNQGFPLTGTPQITEIENASQQFLQQSANSYQVDAPYSGVSRVLLAQSDVEELDGQVSGRVIRKTFAYDTHGNLTQTYHHGDVAVSGDETDERTDWTVDANTWLHRPKRMALYNGAGALIREKWLYYDNQAHGILGSAGLVTKASGITSCTTGSAGAWVYTYNRAGDLLTQKDAKNQTLTFTYDSIGRPLTKK